MNNETRIAEIDGKTYIVQRYRILGTKCYVHVAYAKVDTFLENDFTTLNNDDKFGWLGQIGSERLPAELKALPALTDERQQAVRQWREERYQEAYKAILEAFPEAAYGTVSMGQVEIQSE